MSSQSLTIDHWLYLVLAGEERFPGEELCEDAAAGPDVDGGGVARAQQHLRTPVPQRHNLQASNIINIAPKVT